MNKLINKDDIILQEYEVMYIEQCGRKKNIPNSYFDGLTSLQQQQLAIKIIKFAIEKYLNWGPADVKRYLSYNILKKMKLDLIVRKYIAFPPEYSNKDFDMTYLAYLLYPQHYHLNVEEQCINMLKRVCNGEIAKFPSSWVDGTDGIQRFSILFQHVLSQVPRFQNIEEMYAFFASKKGVEILNNYKIYTFAISLYGTPFDAMHYSLPPKSRNDFLYHYYKFNKAFKSAKRKYKNK